MNILDAYKEYKIAKNAVNLTDFQREKEQKVALGKIVLSVAEKADKIPLIMGVGFAGMSSSIALDDKTGFILASAVVVAKGVAYLAKRSEFVDPYVNREFYEEKIAIELFKDSKEDYLLNKMNTLSSSMGMLIGWNKTYNNAKRLNSMENFLKWGKKVVMDAFVLGEEKFASLMETKEEKHWLKRFLTKPVNKLIPKSLKIYFENMNQKKNLMNWIQSRYDNFEDTEYFKFLEKQNKGLFHPYQEFQKDLDKVFRESYKEVLQSSIKHKFIEMTNDYFHLINRVRNKDILKKQFDENFKKKFQNIAELYEKTKNPSYKVISELAKNTLKNVENNNYKYVVGWGSNNSEDLNRKIITSFIDKISLKYNQKRIANIAKVNNPLVTIFNKKLNAIIETKVNKDLTIKEAEKKVDEAAFTEIELTFSEKEKYSESIKQDMERRKRRATGGIFKRKTS